MYATDGRAIATAKDAEELNRVWREIVAKLREKLPPFEEFRATFIQVHYSDSATKDRKLARYILGRFANQGKTRTLRALDQWTIEHIASQNPPQEQDRLPIETIGSLGNMLLIPDELNNKLKNKDFLKKKKAFSTYPDYALESYVANAPEWNEDSIDERTETMAGSAYNQIWKF